MTVQIIVADGNPIVRWGILHVVQSLEYANIAGEAKDASELLSLLATKSCDVLIMDFHLHAEQHRGGFVLLNDIRQHYPNVKIVVLSLLNNLTILRNLVKLQVHAVLSKLDDFEQIPLAIGVVAQGKSYFPHYVMASLTSKSYGREDSELTVREIEVVRLFASGMTVTEIAKRLNRSIKTISTQKNKAMLRLGIANNYDLYRYAEQNGLI